jgi:hypothetical protein
MTETRMDPYYRNRDYDDPTSGKHGGVPTSGMARALAKHSAVERLMAVIEALEKRSSEATFARVSRIPRPSARGSSPAFAARRPALAHHRICYGSRSHVRKAISGICLKPTTFGIARHQ